MKIVLVSFTHEKNIIRSISSLASWLSEENDVAVVIKDGTYAPYFECKVKTIYINNGRGPGYTSLASMYHPGLNDMIIRINKIKPDVIHILSRHPLNVFLYAFFKGDAKKLYTMSAYDNNSPFNLLLSPFNCILDRISISWADKIIINDRVFFNRCIRYIPWHKLAYIPFEDYELYNSLLKRF
jgi:hypothetical protein